MLSSGYPLNAFVIIDNNAIVGITEFCCDHYKNYDFKDAIPLACKEIEELLNAVKKFSINSEIYTTPCIHDEFKPEKGVLSKHRGFQKCYCESLRESVLSNIEILTVNMNAIERLRNLKDAPRKLGEHLSALSDPDLSLALLALGIANQYHQLVYILVDEEDLRYFVSWMKAKPEIKAMCAHPDKVEALHSMAYLDSVHRNCAITSESMNAMIAYQSISQMSRSMLFGTTKGALITDTYSRIYSMISESSDIKKKMKEAIR